MLWVNRRSSRWPLHRWGVSSLAGFPLTHRQGTHKGTYVKKKEARIHSHFTTQINVHFAVDSPAQVWVEPFPHQVKHSFVYRKVTLQRSLTTSPSFPPPLSKVLTEALARGEVPNRTKSAANPWPPIVKGTLRSDISTCPDTHRKQQQCMQPFLLIWVCFVGLEWFTIVFPKTGAIIWHIQRQSGREFV